MAKVSKNQRINRGGRDESTPMAKVVMAEKKANGKFRFRERIVRQSDVDSVLSEAQQANK